MKLTLPLPPPLNRMYRTMPGGRGLYKTAACKNWEHDTQWVAKAEKPVLIEGPVRMEVKLFLGTDRDIDSSCKGLHDCLEGIAYHNDRQITELRVVKSRDTKNPRMEVEVTAIPAPPAA